MYNEKDNSLNLDQFNTYYGLEEHLKAFRNIPLYEKLCCSWEVDKQKYINRISTSAQRFPHYSDHGESHSKKIVSSIEFILGKKRIKQLSVSDTWLLLQCAYSHDIGMSISANDLFKKMAADKDFYNEIKSICDREDSAREAFEFIQPLFDYYVFKRNDDGNSSNEEEYIAKTNLSQRIDARTQYNIFVSNDLASWPLKLINAFSIILENYARPRHGEFSEEMLTKDFAEVCENGIVPVRLRYLVARISSFHMEDREKLLSEFPQESLGICNDYMHPRFAAIMLRLGDLLDLDNGRFNQAQLGVLGDVPYVTLIHQFKHEAVTHFLITPLEISVKANFTSDTANKLLMNQYTKKTAEKNISDSEKIKLCMKACKSLYEWLQLLQDELDYLSINWLQIVPRKFDGTCPYFVKPSLLINGRVVQEYELNLSYKITTKRSAEIIEGAGLYSEPQFTFLREVLQNALDATKIQMYRDVMSGMYPEFYNDNGHPDAEKIKSLTPFCFCEKLKKNLNLYRIEYKIIQNAKNKTICISIRDFGIGITYKDLTGMLRIGYSNKLDSDRNINNMPNWLKPTGSFGIGLQSIFYVTKSFKILSRPRFEKEHVSPPLREMVFYSTRMGGEIDITLCSENEAEKFGFGTEVIIEIDFNDDKDKLMLYANRDENIRNNAYFDAFSNDMRQISNAYLQYLKDLYSNFVIPCIEAKNIKTPSKYNCTPKLHVNDENQSIMDVTFGDFCILTDHGIIKKCNENTTYCFSCWNEKYNILIKYKPCTTGYGYSSNCTLYYKGIKINSKKAKNKIHIPFWDTEIYLFSEYANAILEVSRDEILLEKLDDIIDSIYRVHFCCLKFIFNNENQIQYRQILETIWKQQNYDAETSFALQENYLYAARSYLATLMFFVSSQERVDFEFRNDFLYLNSRDNKKLIPYDNIAYYVKQGGFLNRNFVATTQDLAFFCQTILEMSSEIYFVASRKLPKRDLSLQYVNDKNDQLVIVEDYFYNYPQFAAGSFKMFIVTGWEEPIVIYKLVKRSGELVKSDEKDFWKFCIRLYKNAIKSCRNLDNEKQRIRLVFPSNYSFQKISVSKLVKGIGHKEVIKFNSYIISPLSLFDLEMIINECKDNICDINRSFDEFFSENWIDENKLLINHIDLYSIMNKKNGSCIAFENDCEVYLQYKAFLKIFIKKYFDEVE